MLLERRDQQNAADAAALAGARFVLTSSSDAETAARRIARIERVRRRRPGPGRPRLHPADPRAIRPGMPGFIEVQIEATRPSIFGGIIGRAVWPVGAYAVATNKQDLHFPFSMLALDPTACKAIQVSGTGRSSPPASIQSNSTGEECSPPVSFSRTGGSTITVGADVYCRAVGPIQDQGQREHGGVHPGPELVRAARPPPQPPGAGNARRCRPCSGRSGHYARRSGGLSHVAAPASASSPALCDLGGNGSTYHGQGMGPVSGPLPRRDLGDERCQRPT